MFPKRMKDDLKSGVVLEGDPYRVFLENEQEDIVWISSCPLKHGTEQEHGFFMRGDMLSEGSNACLKQSKTEIVLCGEQVSLRFPFAFLQCLEKHDSFLHEEYFGVLQSDCGILYPTSNGFAAEARGKVGVKFSSSEPVHLYNLDEYCLIFDRNDRIVFSVNCILENMQVRPKFRTESNGTDHVVEVTATSGQGMILTFNAYAPKRFFDTPQRKTEGADDSGAAYCPQSQPATTSVEGRGTGKFEPKHPYIGGVTANHSTPARKWLVRAYCGGTASARQ